MFYFFCVKKNVVIVKQEALEVKKHVKSKHGGHTTLQ